jgi:hypothetical protein
MKKLIFTLLLLFAAPSVALAQDTWGVDTLALARMDARMVTQDTPEGWYVGALEGTFGDPLPNLERIAREGKLGGHRTHLFNWTCYRNRSCEKGEPKITDLATLGKRAAKYQALHSRYPRFGCFLSPWLEYDERDPKKVEAAINVIRTHAPSCTPVLSPYKGVTIPGVLVERHGNKAKADITSNDGEHLFDSDSSAFRTSGRKITFGWIPRFNLRVSGEKTFTPPSRRKNKPTPDNFKQVVAVLRPPAGKPSQKPAQCKTVREVTKPNLYKPNSEDYGTPDKRGDRPLLIWNKKVGSNFNILAPNGKKIGCAKYYGTYEGGGYRHYVGDCSGDSGVSLMREAGGEWVYYQEGSSSNCLLVQTVRRVGYFR